MLRYVLYNSITMVDYVKRAALYYSTLLCMGREHIRSHEDGFRAFFFSTFGNNGILKSIIAWE